MLQNFLIDRFRLKIHHELRILPHYELTVARGGPKLKRHSADAFRSSESPVPEGVIGVRMATDRTGYRGSSTHSRCRALEREIINEPIVLMMPGGRAGNASRQSSDSTTPCSTATRQV